MRYLLDTNIVSDLVRRPQGRIAQHIREVGEAQVCTSVIVAAELRYGAAKKGSQRLTAQLGAVLGALDILPFEAPADEAYGLIRARLEVAGQLPSEGRFSAADISEYGRSLHGVLHYHAKKRSSAWGGEWRNSN